MIHWLKRIAASIPPAAANHVRLFVDAADGLYKTKDEAGNLVTLGGVGSFNGRGGAVVPLQADYDTFFTTPTEATAISDAAITAHNAAGDPHPQYLLPSEGNAAYAKLIGPPTLTNATATLTTEQLVARWAIPANYISAGMGFNIHLTTQTAAASLLTFRVRVGAAGTTADSLVATFTATAAQAANAYQNVIATLFANSGTTIRGAGFVVAQAAVLGTVTGANAAATINPAATVFVSVTLAEGTTAGVITVISAALNPGV